jgi:hypothetical protein
MKYLKTYENQKNGKFWKIPIDEYLFMKLDKIGVSVNIQEELYDHFLDRFKYKNAALAYFVFVSINVNDLADWIFDDNHGDIIFKKEGYERQPDIELTQKDIEIYKLKKDAERYNL